MARRRNDYEGPRADAHSGVTAAAMAGEVVKTLTPETALLALGQCYCAASSGEKSKLPDELLQCSYMKDEKERLLMASPTVRHFFNMLGGYAKRVLEVGAYLGGSTVALAYGNENEVVTIDNFSEPHGQEGVRERCIAHLKNAPNAKLIEADARTRDLADLGKFDLMFLDGHHGVDETRAVVKRALPVMADVCLMILDDWNEHTVQAATLQTVQAWTQHKILWYFNPTGDMSDNPFSFWNGMCFILFVKDEGPENAE